MTRSTPAALTDETLTQALAAALRTTIFHSGLRVSPRRIQEIARNGAETYNNYRTGALDAAAVLAAGQQLAIDGLGHGSLLAMVEAILRSELGLPTDSEAPTSLAYMTALLSGYMAAREALLIQEQGRTHAALERVRAQHHQI